MIIRQQCDSLYIQNQLFDHGRCSLESERVRDPPLKQRHQIAGSYEVRDLRDADNFPPVSRDRYPRDALSLQFNAALAELPIHFHSIQSRVIDIPLFLTAIVPLLTNRHSFLERLRHGRSLCEGFR
jgi:hypothetical protein